MGPACLVPPQLAEAPFEPGHRDPPQTLRERVEGPGDLDVQPRAMRRTDPAQDSQDPLRGLPRTFERIQVEPRFGAADRETQRVFGPRDALLKNISPFF